MGLMDVAMVTGFGRGFGDASANQESCGEDRQRRTRPGYASQCWLLGCQHLCSPSASIAPVGQVEPPSRFEWLPFGYLMRRKVGDEPIFNRLKHLVIARNSSVNILSMFALTNYLPKYYS
jgi:hypothetical protein